MEQNHAHSPKAAAPAFHSSHPQRPAEPPPLSPPEQLVSQSLNQTFAGPGPGETEGADRSARRQRHDGWTPERQIVFLEALAACGVVMDACKQAGLTSQSAYAFRNRRSGRAFGTAWDAVLVHRARGRLSDELLSRAMNGCIEAIHQNGEITGERHRFDNRLSMAVLTRLDRLAEKEGHREEQLRAVSEDLDDFLDCVEQGGDADGFVEARRPAPLPEPEPQPDPQPAAEAPPGPPREDEVDRMASLIGCLHYKSMHPLDLDISDLAENEFEWGPEGYVRAYYSGYLHWLAVRDSEERGREEQGEEPGKVEDRSPQAYMKCLEEAFANEAADPQAAEGVSSPHPSHQGPEGASALDPSTSSTCPDDGGERHG